MSEAIQQHVADLAAGMIIVRCPQCHRVWVARPRGPDADYGVCGARGPSDYTCHGRFLAPTDPVGEIVQAAFALGSWHAVTELMDQNPVVAAWGWYSGGALSGYKLPEGAL